MPESLGPAAQRLEHAPESVTVRVTAVTVSLTHLAEEPNLTLPKEKS
jgi:hypothetical protein